jgi:hypothetical protein
MGTVVFYTDPQELIDMGYNWKDCNVQFECSINDDGAVDVQCQQARLYQSWECIPEDHVDVDPTDQYKPPYIPNEEVQVIGLPEVTPVEETVAEEVQVEEIMETPEVESVQEPGIAGLFLAGIVASIVAVVSVFRA